MTLQCSISIADEAIQELQDVALPDTTTIVDLQQLIDNINEDSDLQQNYDFYIDNNILTTNLHDFLLTTTFSTEQTLQIKAIPSSSKTVAALSRCSADLPGHEDSILSLQFAPQSNELASGSGDKTIRIWDLNTSTCKYILSCFQDWVLSIKYSPDGDFLAAADHSGNLYLFDVRNQYQLLNRQQSGKVQKNKWITQISWRFDSQYFYTAGRDGVVRQFSRKCIEVKAIVQLQKCVTDVCACSDKLVVSSEDCKIYIFDLLTLKHLQTYRHAHWVNSISSNLEFYLRFGIYALQRNFDQIKRILNGICGIKSLKEFDALQLEQKQEVLKKFLTSQQEKIVSTSDDHSLQIIQLKPQIQQLQQLTGHVKAVTDAKFSPNGQFIASAGFDRSVRLFDCQGKFLQKFYNHVSEVYKLAFSSDSRYLISCSKDSTCKLYSLKQRKMIRDLPGHYDEVYCIDWSLDGQMGASGGKDKVVKIWRR